MIRKGCFLLPAAIAGATFFAGCSGPQQAYFVSPFNGNQSVYHTIPKITDSVHSAVYGGVALSRGSANTQGNDNFFTAHGSLYAAHSFSHVQLFYGGNLSLGNYSIGQYPNYYAVPPPYQSGYPSNYANGDALLPYAGDHSFGGVGFQAGINAVVPIGIGEWRLIGLETSVQQEWGGYLAARKRMPDSIATLINRDPTFASVGLTSELVAHTRNGEFGFRWAYGWALGRNYADPGIRDNETQTSLHYVYFNFHFHYTWDRMTAYLMVNNVTKAQGGQVGINYRLFGGR